MKSKTIGTIILFVVIMLAALYGYKYLSGDYRVAEEQKPIEEATSLKKADDFSVIDVNGNVVKLSDNLGKPTIINFWASWCSPCKVELPDFDNAYKEFGEEINFMMVNLTDGSRETVEGVKSFVSQNKFSFPVLFDTQGNGSSAYKVSSIPTTIVINKDGMILNSYIGVISEYKLSVIVKNLLN